MSDVIFAKISNDRAEEFSICTDMVKQEDGQIKVRKYGASSKADEHINNIIKWSELLKEQYSGSELDVCASRKNGNTAESLFCEGKTLEEIVDLYIHEKEYEKAEHLIKKYLDIIRDRNSSKEFTITDEFKKVFGEVKFNSPMKTADVNDIDMVLNNVIVTEDGWKLIDYEWTFDFPIPVEFILYRVCHYYFETNNLRKVFGDKQFINISQEDKETFARMEVSFQNYVKGNTHPMRELYTSIGKQAVNVGSVLENLRKSIRIYTDNGEGYVENGAKNYTFIPVDGKTFNISFPVSDTAIKYRVDPGETGCTIKFNKVVANDRIIIPFITNGIEVGEDAYVCGEDPWIEFDVKDTIINSICIEFEMDTNITDCFDVLKSNVERADRAEAAIAAINAAREGLEKQLSDANNQIQNLNREKEVLLASRSFKVTKPLRYLKKGTKELLKSNKVTHAVCKKAKAIIRGEKAPKPVHPEVKDVAEIVNIMCPKKEWQKQHDTKFDKDVTFSILVPLYNTPERFLREMIESVQYQTYEKWELCLADGSDDEHTEVGRICNEYVEQDKRIVYKKLDENKGISGNTNACIDMSSGNYIALFDHDDFLHPTVLFEDMKAICEHNADYIYTDEATFEGTNIFNIITRHCKPDFAIDNLRANNYICHFSVFKRDLLDKAGRFRSEYDGSQDHDLILRLTDKAQKVFHIRKILYFWRSHPNSVASNINAKTYAIDAAKRAVESHFESAGLKAEVESSKAFPTIFKFKYELNATPKVSILIPNKDHVEDLKVCINSILEKSTYPDYEIIVIENNSIKNETFEYYEEIKQNDKIKVVNYVGDFNYSKINNFGEKSVTGEYIILLNNDTEVISEDWIEELLMYAQRDDVAVVGAKLYYADDTIQHAGIVIGLGADRAAGHTHYGVDRENVGYMGRLFYAQDVSAVTGACMMVRKSIYDDLGGLDEEFTVAFNDVDFCLKARDKGYLNVFTPYCEMYHYESKSRGFEDTRSKKKRFREEVDMFRTKWKKVIDNGDPYYNPNFSLDRSDFYIQD